MEGRFQRTLSPRKGPWSQLACPWHTQVLLPPGNVRSWASSADVPPSKAAGRGQWEQEATCKHLRKEGGDIFVLASGSQEEKQLKGLSPPLRGVT